MFDIKIRSIKDVEQFFDYLVKTLHLNFHPDTDFMEYINLEAEVNTFSPHEAEILNSLMSQCFIFCEALGADIYEIALRCYHRSCKIS